MAVSPAALVPSREARMSSSVYKPELGSSLHTWMMKAIVLRIFPMLAFSLCACLVSVFAWHSHSWLDLVGSARSMAYTRPAPC